MDNLVQYWNNGRLRNHSPECIEARELNILSLHTFRVSGSELRGCRCRCHDFLRNEHREQFFIQRFNRRNGVKDA